MGNKEIQISLGFVRERKYKIMDVDLESDILHTTDLMSSCCLNLEEILVVV